MKSPDPLPAFDVSAAVMREAGAWLARRDRGLSAREELALQAWLEAAPQHRAAFRHLERVSASFDRLQELAPPPGGEPDPDLLAPRQRAFRWTVPLAAAGLAAAAALVVLFWPARISPPPTGHFATGPAGYERAVLADGSIVELNGGTEIDVEFTASERRARLARGEAHFRIAHDPSRTFVVKASSVALRVVGTAFNVRIEAGGIEVVVTDGTVEVLRDLFATSGRTASPPPATPAPRLTAGQKIMVPTAAENPLPVAVSATPADVERVRAWQSRTAEFRRAPLRDVAAEFNRHSAGRYPPIVIASEELAALRIGGNLRLDDPEAFVRLLEGSFGVIADRSPDRIVLKKAP